MLRSLPFSAATVCFQFDYKLTGRRRPTGVLFEQAPEKGTELQGNLPLHSRFDPDGDVGGGAGSGSIHL